MILSYKSTDYHFIMYGNKFLTLVIIYCYPDRFDLCRRNSRTNL